MPCVWEEFRQMPVCKATYSPLQYSSPFTCVRMTRTHWLEQYWHASISARRLHKELSEINVKGCPAGIKLLRA
ncbi:hypothetical protein PISMIDRAFT_420454, partial [Pisolithus microcarpus 441]